MKSLCLADQRQKKSVIVAAYLWKFIYKSIFYICIKEIVSVIIIVIHSENTKCLLKLVVFVADWLYGTNYKVVSW